MLQLYLLDLQLAASELSQFTSQAKDKSPSQNEETLIVDTLEDQPCLFFTAANHPQPWKAVWTNMGEHRSKKDTGGWDRLGLSAG